MKAFTLPLLSLPLLLTSLAHAQPAPEPPPPPPPPALPATGPAPTTPPAATPPAATPPAATPPAATPVVPPAAPAPAAAPPAGAPPAPVGAAPAAPSAPAKPPADDEDEEGAIVIHSTRPADMQKFANESLEEIRVGQTKSRYALNLFGDLSLGAASRSEGSTRPEPAFAVGVFDMLFTANLMNDLQATSEVTFAYSPNNPSAELERLHIRWKPSRYFFFEMGRFHTDFGYWNVAYHHGKWLQLPIERPRTIGLHSGLVSMHMIGAQAGTSIPVAKGAINFVVATGSAHDKLGAGHAAHGGAAFNPIGAVQAKLETDSIGVRDLHVGVSGMYSFIPAEPAFTRPGLPDVGIGEYVGGAHIAFPSLPFSLLSEAYLIQHFIKNSSHSPEAGSKWRSIGVFAMAGYNIGKFTPYLKGEWVRSERSTLLPDPLWVPEPKGVGDLDVAMGLLEGTAGLRIDVSTWSALKLEYRLTTGDGHRREADPHPSVHTGTVNWSFGI